MKHEHILAEIPVHAPNPAGWVEVKYVLLRKDSNDNFSLVFPSNQSEMTELLIHNHELAPMPGVLLHAETKKVRLHIVGEAFFEAKLDDVVFDRFISEEIP